MSSIDRKKLVSRFDEVYQPNNMILCVVGDADFEEIVKFAEKNFEFKKGSVPSFKITPLNKMKIENRKGIDQSNLVFAYHVPVSKDKKNYAAQILNTLMAEGMSSILFLEIREKRNLAYAVKGDSNINRDFAYNLVLVGTTKDNVEIVKKIIIEEFDEVSKNLAEKKLNEIKEQVIGNHQISMEDSQGQMTGLIFSEINGKAEDFYDYEKNIRNVKLEDVKELAKNAAENYSFVALVPE
jgi:predicted Zn-dependent peptidase